ncbi:MAG: IclR family transcriptional regulator [Firmicutes bacterium]|nr:IclR family transcriptional regulator [Bacillota bacterium]
MVEAEVEAKVAKVDKETVRSVERALDILLCFVDQPRGLGVTQVADRIGLYKSTVHRLLQTLESKGFVRRDGISERYHLGERVLQLAASFPESDDLPAVATPEMIRLRDETGETVSLYIRDGVDRVRIHKAEGLQAVRRVVQLGERMPLFVGASSKVLLAYAPEDMRQQVLSPEHLPPGFDRRSLEKQLARVRRLGYAVSVEEREPGSAAVAAPIADRSGRVSAALAVSGPAVRFQEESVERYATLVRLATERIAQRLGWA